ncbi:MAG: endolytic transglycosylase MltG [Luteitalea sp.]|nr:endolytic transglycosylase MltG [Luteitalea sp.]
MRRWLLLTLLVFAAVGVLLGVIAYRVVTPYKGYAADEQFVDIRAGSSQRAIGDRLVESGVVRDRIAFRVAVRLGARGRALKAGEYRFGRPASMLEVVDKLARGDVYLRPLTIPEGLTIAEMATLFNAKGFGAEQHFLEAASDPTPIRDLDPDARDLEGYLFPDTYNLPRRVDARELVNQMVGRFKAVFDDRMRARVSGSGQTVRELVTLASMVEKETGQDHERSLVAAVFANRLQKGIGLYSDPTIIYALTKTGRYEGNLSRADLRLDSPYNTYKYPGLPPGPIAAPGRASLTAALEPASVDYLYFVSRNDGSHVFAHTLDEHNKNVREYQVRYFRERRGKG